MENFTDTLSHLRITKDRPAPADQSIKQLEALADSTRLRITAALLNEHLSLHELARKLGASRNGVLTHLSVLRDAGIVAVEATTIGRRYSVPGIFEPRTSQIMFSILACFRSASRAAPEHFSDAVRALTWVSLVHERPADISCRAADKELSFPCLSCTNAARRKASR